MKGAEGAEKRWGPKACTHHTLTHPCETYLEPREKAEEQKGGTWDQGAENKRKEPKSTSHLHALNQLKSKEEVRIENTLNTKGSSSLPTTSLTNKKRKEKVQTQPQNIWRMRGQWRRVETKKRDRERKESGVGLMAGRLLVARRKMRRQVLMLMGNSRDRNMPCRICMENTIGGAPFGRGGK